MRHLSKQQALNLLPLVVDEEANEDEIRAFFQYIKHDEEIRRKYQSMKRVKDLVRQRTPRKKTPDYLKEKISILIEEERQKKSRPYPSQLNPNEITSGST